MFKFKNYKTKKQLREQISELKTALDASHQLINIERSKSDDYISTLKQKIKILENIKESHTYNLNLQQSEIITLGCCADIPRVVDIEEVREILSESVAKAIMPYIKISAVRTQHNTHYMDGWRTYEAYIKLVKEN